MTLCLGVRQGGAFILMLVQTPLSIGLAIVHWFSEPPRKIKLQGKFTHKPRLPFAFNSSRTMLTFGQNKLLFICSFIQTTSIINEYLKEYNYYAYA